VHLLTPAAEPFEPDALHFLDEQQQTPKVAAHAKMAR
jgi:hypothetical protein